MNRNKIIALVLIGLAVVLMVMNKGTVDVNMLFKEGAYLKSLVFLSWTALGVLIGVLLK